MHEFRKRSFLDAFSQRYYEYIALCRRFGSTIYIETAVPNCFLMLR